MRQGISILLSILLVFAAVSGTAEENGEVQNWMDLGDAAFDQEDYETSLQYYLLAADRGDPLAQCKAAWQYVTGFGTEISTDMAYEYYGRAAEQEDPDGLECLGYLYLEGLGVEQSMEKAMELYKRAAELGSEEAQRQLAIYGN